MGEGKKEVFEFWFESSGLRDRISEGFKLWDSEVRVLSLEKHLFHFMGALAKVGLRDSPARSLYSKAETLNRVGILERWQLPQAGCTLLSVQCTCFLQVVCKLQPTWVFLP